MSYYDYTTSVFMHTDENFNTVDNVKDDYTSTYIFNDNSEYCESLADNSVENKIIDIWATVFNERTESSSYAFSEILLTYTDLPQTEFKNNIG